MRKVMLMCVLSAAALAGACGGGKKIGVASCDEFVAKERACGDKIGGEQGTGLKKQADMMVDAWSADAKDKDAAGSLDDTCKEALADAAKTLTQCDWK